MGCVSSHLLNQEDDFTQMGHHIVSLTSTTYGLLTLDPSPTTVPPTPPPPFALPSPSTPKTQSPLEVIDSRELMAGLDSTPETLFFTPQPSKPSPFRYPLLDKDPNPNREVTDFRRTVLGNGRKFQGDRNPNRRIRDFLHGFEEPSKLSSFGCTLVDKDREFEENPNTNCKNPDFRRAILDKDQENPNPNCKTPDFRHAVVGKDYGFQEKSYPNGELSNFLLGFEELCPPNGENRVVIYTTTLRGVRKTFEACNAVRAALEGFGVAFCERDISMDRSFKEELWGLMKGKEKRELIPPRVFVKGRYVGGCDEVLKIVEEGCLGQLLDGLPRLKAGYVCEVCGGARFIPCVVCNGSCKLVRVLKKEIDGRQLGNAVSVKCMDCNENGLVCCPVCS